MRAKRLIIGVTLLLLSIVTLATAVLLSGAISGERLKPYLITSADKYLGYSLNVAGDVEYKVFPVPHIKVADVSLKHKNDDQAERFSFSVKELELYVSLYDLIKGKIVIDSLKLNAPNIVLSSYNSWQTPQIIKPKSKQQDLSSFNTNIIKTIEIKQGHLDVKDPKLKLSSVDFKIGQNVLTQEFEGAFTLNYNGHDFTGDFGLDLADIGASILGLESKVSIPRWGVETTNAGIISWSDNFSYQGEVKASVNTMMPNVYSAYDQPINLSSLVSINKNEKGQAYDVLANTVKINQGTYNYKSSIEGQLLGKSHLAEVAVKLESDLAPDVSLDTAVDRVLGNLIYDLDFKVDRQMNIDMNSSLKALKHDFYIDYTHAKGQSPFIRVRAPMVSVSDIYKERQVIAENKPELFDTYMAQGQDFFHNELLSYIKQIPNMPPIRVNVSSDNVIYDKHNISDVLIDVEYVGDNNITVHRLDGTLMGRDPLSLQGTLNTHQTYANYDLNLSFEAKKPNDILLYLPEKPAVLNLKFSGSSNLYNWTGDADVSGNKILFKALHKEQLPKDHVSLLLLNFDLKNVNDLIFSPDLRRAIRQLQLVGNSEIEAQIGLLKDKSFQLDYMRGNLNKTALNVQGNARFIGQAPEYNFDVSADKIFYKSEVAQAKKKSTNSGQLALSRKEVRFPVSDDFKASLNIAIDNFYLEKSHLQSVKGNFMVENGGVKVEQLKFQGFGGGVDYKGEYLTADKGRMNNVFTIQSVSGASLYKGFTNTKKKSSFDGLFSLNGSVQSTGRSSSALVYNLSGVGKLSGSDIVIKGVDIAKIGQTLRLDTKLEKNLTALDNVLGSAMNDGVTKFAKAEVPYKVESGVIKIDKGQFVSQDFDLQVNGTVSLADNVLDLKNTIIYKGEGSDNLPAVSFTLKGPINAPVKDLATNVVEEFIKNKINQKLNKTLNNVLQELLPTAPRQQEPANDNQTGTNEQPSETAPQKIDPAQLLLRQILGQ